MHYHLCIGFICLLYLANILSPLTGNSDYTVTNSAHFVSTISSETILDNKIMVTFDVELLFTNIPIDCVIHATQNWRTTPALRTAQH